MNTKKLPELLAPAGTLDAFKTAILYGADAIYAGLPGFSMRARAKINDYLQVPLLNGLIVKLFVPSAKRQKLAVISPFNHLAVLNNKNLVSVTDGR